MVLGSTQPLTEISNRSIFSWGKGGRCVRLTTYHHPVPLSRNMGTLNSWNPLGHSRHVTALLYLFHISTCTPFFIAVNINLNVISLLITTTQWSEHHFDATLYWNTNDCPAMWKNLNTLKSYKAQSLYTFGVSGSTDSLPGDTHPRLLVHTCPILSLRQTVLFTTNRISAAASFTRVWRWMYFRESVNRIQVSYKNAETVREVFWKSENRCQKLIHWQGDPCVNRDKRPWTMGTECFGRRSQWPWGLRLRSAAPWLLEAWVRIPLKASLPLCWWCR